MTVEFTPPPADTNIKMRYEQSGTSGPFRCPPELPEFTYSQKILYG